jgi:tetratricopeptide (TPR) repeat protein
MDARMRQSSLRQSRLRAPAVAVALIFAVLARQGTARADDAVTAREHYQKGTSYYDLGRYPEAIQEFEAAYEIKNDPALLYNLAQSNRLAGNSEQALHFYRTYLRYVPKAANRAEIEDRIKQLDQLLAQKNAAQTPPNQAIPPGGAPAPAPPPALTPPAEAPPSATPPPGLPEEPAAASPPMMFAPGPAPTPANDHHQMILAGKITAAVGGALFIIGAAYGAAAVGAANDVNNEAKNGQAFDPSVEKRGKDSQKAEAVLLTLGALTGATGGILFFYGRHLAAQEAQASITPVASSSGGGVSLRVTF